VRQSGTPLPLSDTGNGALAQCQQCGSLASRGRPTPVANDENLPLGTSDSLPRVPKVSEMLANRLRGMILGRDMKPGDRLSSESELITRYGAARSTVREALRLLEAEGLIEIRRGRQGGILVRQPDLDRIRHSLAILVAMEATPLRELVEFRMLIEPAAAAAAARTATDEQCAWLWQVVNGDDESTFSGAANFHEAVAKCSNNTFIAMVIAGLTEEFVLESSAENLSQADIAATRRAHRAIAKAIEAHDPARAEKAMLRHIERFRDILAPQGRLDETIVPRTRWLSEA
jgi:DNA-binding FadR family transcriptional regulator